MDEHLYAIPFWSNHCSAKHTQTHKRMKNNRQKKKIRKKEKQIHLLYPSIPFFLLQITTVSTTCMQCFIHFFFTLFTSLFLRISSTPPKHDFLNLLVPLDPLMFPFCICFMIWWLLMLFIWSNHPNVFWSFTFVIGPHSFLTFFLLVLPHTVLTIPTPIVFVFILFLLK